MQPNTLSIAAQSLQATPPLPRIRAIAQQDALGNPVFWGVLDQVDPGDVLILTDGKKDWCARVLSASETLITAQDNQQQWLFCRSGPRAGRVAGH